MERFKLLVVFVVLTAVPGVGIPEYAGPEFEPGPPPHFIHPFHKPFHALNLTEEQKANLNSMREGLDEQIRDHMEKAHKIHMEMQKLMVADVIDEAAIRAKAVELANAQADSAIARAYFMQQLRSILTPEQLGKLKEIESEMHECMGKFPPPVPHR